MGDIHEKVNGKAWDNIYREAREAGKSAGEGIIKKLTDKGFRDEDVRRTVRNGVLDSVGDLAKK